MASAFRSVCATVMSSTRVGSGLGLGRQQGSFGDPRPLGRPAMSRVDPAGFSRVLARLKELGEVEALVAEARERAEAVLEIDARAAAGGPAATCLRCGGEGCIRWARTRTGAQRWRRSGRWRRGRGDVDGPLARVHRPDPKVALARDMMKAPQPMSCCRAARVPVGRHGTAPGASRSLAL